MISRQGTVTRTDGSTEPCIVEWATDQPGGVLLLRDDGQPIALTNGDTVTFTVPPQPIIALGLASAP